MLTPGPRYIGKELQKIIIAESGANDGLGYPFLLLPLYVMKYTGEGGAGQPGGAAKAMGYWFGETWVRVFGTFGGAVCKKPRLPLACKKGYTIILSVLYGAAVGYLAKELLRWAYKKEYVDRESFLVFAITLAVSLSPNI